MTHEHFMQQAIDITRQGIDQGQTPFGAAIVKNNQVITLVHNQVWKDTDITAHAEIRAIRLACKTLNTIDLTGCTIYSTCEPCPMCFAACHWARIDHIVFGARIEDAQNAGFNELTISCAHMKHQGQSPVKLTTDILRPQAAQLFQYWLNNPNHQTY